MRRPFVLVVDDDEDLRALVCRLLQDAGAQTLGAPDAEEGTRLLASQSFDVVLCDYFLPGRNGASFLHDVRTRHPEARCLAMTGHPDPFILGRGHDDGYFVMTKPVDPSLLMALVGLDGTLPAAPPPPALEVSARSWGG